MRLLVIDGNSIMNRAYYGIKLLSTKDGRFTNAIVGFLNILGKLRESVQPDGIAVAFDVHAPTFRHRQYAAYKAGRKKTPDELLQQMPVIKELLGLMGITVVEKEGFEADDILGTLARASVRQQGMCFLATGDRDALQLVGDGVSVLLATTKMGRPETTCYDATAIREKYDLSPGQLIDLKALMGDASDNIPGVPGIGEKTALDLLHRYGELDTLYGKLDTDGAEELRPAVRQKLLDGRDSAYMSRELGTICCDAPVETVLEAYRLREPQKEPLARLMAELELFRLMEKWGLDAADTRPPELPAGPVSPLEGAEAADELLQLARNSGRLDFLLRMQDGSPSDALLGTQGRTCLIPAGHPAFDQLFLLLADGSVRKRTHDCKTVYAALLHKGIQPAGFEMDTLLAAYLLNPLSNNYSLVRLAQEYALPWPEAEGDDAMDITLFPLLADHLSDELHTREMATLLTDMEMPLALVLADMERLGFAVDREGIAAFGDALQADIDRLQRDIYAAVGYSFNLNSPKQLAKALFDDLGLPAGKKTKSGYSTSADVLERLKSAHPAVAMLLEYRTLAKLKSTYCDGLLKVIGADGRIHSSFNQTETRTGRISSTEPNLQNIPVRQALGRELRRFFRAADGWTLVDADYSQIELRVLAHMADEATMKDAFNNGDDIHRITASQVFGIPEELVTPLMRSQAKAVNFGIIYGIGPHSLSEDIGVTYGEAKTYIDGYLAHYSAVAGFMQQMVEDAKRTGYAETLFGRRRPLPELKASAAVMRSFGERVARNAPIQGTAADIIKRAMIQVYRRLEAEKLRARLILQVHDELIVEAPLEEAKQVAAILQEEMEQAAQLSVRLAVDVHSGATWYDAKE